jgi:hypothetical protein
VEESSEEEGDYLIILLCSGRNVNGWSCKNKVSEKGGYCLRHAEVAANKQKMKDMCCHCLEKVSPSAFEGSADLPGELLLNCGKCKYKHHPACLEISSGIVSKLLSYPWDCSNCKLCYTCEATGEEEKMLFCDSCDRGFHMYCLQPPLESLPEGNWSCSTCSKCVSCDRSYAKVFDAKVKDVVPAIYLATYCETCFSHFKNGDYCMWFF